MNVDLWCWRAPCAHICWLKTHKLCLFLSLQFSLCNNLCADMWREAWNTGNRSAHCKSNFTTCNTSTTCKHLVVQQHISLPLCYINNSFEEMKYAGKGSKHLGLKQWWLPGPTGRPQSFGTASQLLCSLLLLTWTEMRRRRFSVIQRNL